jgi:hypothetical protein
MKPNIFDYAAKELSQDAFVAWLLNYADPSRRDRDYTFDDEGLFACGTKLIREMLFTHDITIDSKIKKVTADRQWEGIDIWAEVELMNGKKYLIIVEDNTNTIQHITVLQHNKQIAIVYCVKNGFEPPVCIYLKSGKESNTSIENVKSLGFSVINRKTLIFLLSDYKKIQNNIFIDFYERINELETLTQQFGSKSVVKWGSGDWHGFFNYLDNEFGLKGWTYVNSPNGGSWNAVLNWDHWNGYPVYVQIEEGKVVFKISTEEAEAPLDSEKRVKLRSEFHALLMERATQAGLTEIQRPSRFSNGLVMTVAVVDQNQWMGDTDNQIDLEGAKKKLAGYVRFLRNMN